MEAGNGASQEGTFPQETETHKALGIGGRPKSSAGRKKPRASEAGLSARELLRERPLRPSPVSRSAVPPRCRPR
eukprot:4862951-Alexandrium_andersonii.AAC.1